ncbi:HAL/PAL/TAL family ammonia-lyase [Sporomusa acidovorans]|uniref:Histidine ammonia-lyase n=1 Tax=Sporomusa acidovorans (strain ATCC 49682 / DSM 3132 / Mol) TaxID=1123286 RepID=A0ABZ3J8N2_SPOA4|nr:aromatic amino acid ammonia-lyase [Sporomusa acidovorans]OZC16083.1 histidine ammonia-lyase [Sporomusa acidovorans DSM 3132]SDD87227.1 histidine ammonia-lyase [Sporomusa acidovorans]
MGEQKNIDNTSVVVLGGEMSMEDLVAVARFGAKVEFADEYCQRVKKSRALVEKWVGEERVMYGITTGFGAMCTQVISPAETTQLQRNIVLSHATSVGQPLAIEEVRATMFMVLQNVGQGFCGARLETVELYRQFLNRGLTPFAPREGSVGYLSPEAHMALVLIGEGQAYVGQELLPAQEALRRVGLAPTELSAKEGLILVSGTTSVTALGALALYDMLNAAKCADIIGSMTLEILKGTTRAFDERLMSVRPHAEQRDTAANVRNILKDSEIAAHFCNYRLQDAMSIRCIPQLHGAAKKTLNDALKTIETEINSCCDNPVIWPEGEDGEAISGCNADSSYVGIELDSACIAATMLAKMSERRNNRLVDGNLSGYPAFLIKNPGLNSGLMVPQYTQAGLLNDMKILSHPATIDGIPTCGNQEDYVAMGYNAVKKARQIVENLEFILAIELLSVYQAHQFLELDKAPATPTQAVLKEIAVTVPVMQEDIFLYPHINTIKALLHQQKIVKLVEAKTGKLL